jgi:glycosyltransferase involved in cell wall biosynthesis
MKNKKIFYISPIPPPFGGIAILSKAILDAGLVDKLSIIQLNTAVKGKREKINTIRFIGIINSLNNYLKLFFLCFKHTDSRYAFVTSTNNWGVLRDSVYVFILWVFRVKILLNLHGTRKLKSCNIIVRAFSILEMKMAYKVLSPTKIDFDSASKYINNIEKVHLFYNSAYIPKELINTNKKTINKNKLTLIGIGRLSHAKGTFDLLNVCIDLIKENYNIHLKWIGRGAYAEDDINSNKIVKIEKLEHQIQFLKDLSEEKKYQHLIESDVFVLPTKDDNMPIAILEAMACGKPVISSLMGAIPEVISKDNGWLVNHSSKNELKECIKSIYLKRFDFVKIGNNNRSAFNKFYASENRVKELINFLN